ncbi:amp-dependent synthetase ligase [Trichoderma arundinaceum]|uniref:Amp-dependent synthetase ligase n=1 Tax=Trichoderma arundinaceum TaxID=490622 RepID=A0A395P0N9_TRIAR|nr:amp-dependent synthetase ligase [Trichoderma arundinaceum]
MSAKYGDGTAKLTTNEEPVLMPPNSANSSLSEQDIDQIWSWNASIPPLVHGCVHDLITEIVKSQPDVLAVCAWDGDFTYSQVEDLANEVALRILKLGVEPKSNIPILFPKSRWTCIAMLGVIKAGCSVIALDGTQPDTRLRSIIHQTQPKIIISSAVFSSRAALLVDAPVLQLDDTLLDDLNSPREESILLPSVSPYDIVYISFTSGTTGQPKGACISHANVRSAIRYQGKKLGFCQGARVFDFAPYSFDVAWSNFLHTLCAGGCLCIASEQDMLNDLSSAIMAFQANLINVTPTVLRTINPIPPTIETVLLSGEMPYRQNVTQWAGRVRLLNTYGPTECTFKCAFSVLELSQEGRPDIGMGVGFSTWIVDPENSHQLASIGSVGELYLEGPLVGQGYLSDPEKTAISFVNDPTWLIAGSHSRSGRRGRLYKTGDLVKYKPDGRLLFVGRKDASQFKIRGQRVEIGDVEHHVRACLNDSLPVIVDVILPLGSDNSCLAVFVLAKNSDSERVKSLLNGLAGKLQEVLPSFMIPNIYLPIDDIPVAPTGKVDRRKLREMGSALSWKEIVALQSTILSVREYCEPSNEIERELLSIWSDVLELDLSFISTTDSFLRLGGDSVAAMRVVAGAREKRLSLTVADLFRAPTLRDLAHITGQQTEKPKAANIIPFSLLTGVKDDAEIREEVASLCGIQMAQIEDVYPCTPLQQGMLAMTARDDMARRYGREFPSFRMEYVSRTAFELPKHINVEQLQKAWEITVECTPIIRTRIIDLPGEGLVQVPVNERVPLYPFQEIGGFLECAKPMDLGTPLCRAGITTGDSSYFILEMHHAIFDGWCTALILDTLEAAYHQNEVASPHLGSFQPFIQYVRSSNSPEAANFWKSQFADSEATVFPSPSNLSNKKLDLSHQVTNLRWPRTGITPSSVIRSALALLLASYTNSSDVKYGATVSGRQAPIPGIERIAGPTIATIPVRVKFDWTLTVKALLQQVQQQATELSAFEQFGLQRIQRVHEDNEDASQFQTLLVVQPATRRMGQNTDDLFSKAKSIIIGAENDTLQQETLGVRHNGMLPNFIQIPALKNGSIEWENELPLYSTSESSVPSVGEESEATPIFRLATKDGQADDVGIYNSYALMLICQLEDSGFTIKMNFDSGAIRYKQAQRFAHQFEHLVRQLCTEKMAESTLRDVTAVSEGDLEQIWNWNLALPEFTNELVTDLIDLQAVRHPDDNAILSWDKQITYQQLENISNRLASRLREEGVGPGSIVILSFEKSAWLIVSMISALKIGAVVLPMSAPTSSKRVREIVENLRPALAITFSASGASQFQALIPAFTISELVQFSDEEWLPVLPPLLNKHSGPALILFTSGSTGTPKPILWSHKTLSSNIQAAISSFNITATSKVFQFAGYEFDVSTVEALATLSAGGCLCIPTESDRTDRLSEAINDIKANWVCLTPSVSDSLDPEELPSLKTLVFAGENLQRKTALRWAEKLDAMYNWYGPAEASVATSHLINIEAWRHGMIGSSNSGATWLIDPKNPNVLAAIGAVAELCIEGPILASYAGKSGAALNREAFFTPSWPYRGIHQIPVPRGLLYRTGDLVKYDDDGKILFISRKQDSQRKIRGQRIDLNEVEIRAQSFLSRKLDVVVVAEIISPSGSGNDTLVFFISHVGSEGNEEDVSNFVQHVLPADELEIHLSGHLPSHMIPRVYISIAKVPMSHSGKTDRQRLRLIGSSLTHEELASMQPFRREARKPSDGIETQLQRLWSEVIGIEADAIFANDNFFRLGGDSIAAMRLVASARKQGLLLTAANIFEAPQLEKMATKIKHDFGYPEQEVHPFSLLGNGISLTESRSHAAKLCSVSESRVVDIYPCTSLQQGLLALGARKQGQYVSRSVLELQAGVDTGRLERAWLSTVKKLPILRTRIVDIPGQGLVQVILDNSPLCSGLDVESYLCNDEREPMSLGTELSRATIIDRHFIFTIHHCTYDGDSLKMILDEVESQYLGQPGITVTPFQNFIKHLSQVSYQQAAKFWEDQLAGLEPQQFPVLPSSEYQPQADEDLEYSISLEWGRAGITPSTIIRAAWAILAAQYTSSDDVMFGLTVSGRQANLRGIDRCVGPTISTVPIAISIKWDETIEGFLERLQRQMVEITPFEQFGLQNIQHVHKWLESSLIQTLLVVQPVAEGKSLNEDSMLFKARSFSSNLSTQGTDPFNTYALMIICELATSGLLLRMSFDGNIIQKKQIRRIAYQFETILRQMCSENIATTTLNAVQTASHTDLDFFWRNNTTVPSKMKTCVHDSISMKAKANPTKTVIDAWDGKFSYQQVEDLSTILCHKLMQLGVVKGSVIALCFEKSKWVPIVQVAVFKAGAVSLLQSIAVPERRIATVFKSAGVKLAVVSKSRMDIISQHTRCLTIEQLMSTPHLNVSMELPSLEMHDPAAILVSSGSTGEPKQILWSHRAIAENVKAHGEHLSINMSSRIFQFASYDFDLGTIEVMSALVNQGCVCIPSEAQRLDGLSAAINSFGVNHLNVTPSTAKLLLPEDMPQLSTLVFAGENLVRQDVDRWKGNCRDIINWYGPAECSAATFCAVDDVTWRSGVIGRVDSKHPSLCWLVDPRNSDKLVPLGAVGEIALEGPLCAEGYLGNQIKTDLAFCKDPEFLVFGRGTDQPGRSGRIYCTGDLARYDTNGDLIFLGRKDFQLKIRGQLVAPQEVEYSIRQCLSHKDEIQVVVDAVIPKHSGNTTLVAFITSVTQADLEKLTAELTLKLKSVLPSYAIPSYFIPIISIPMTQTGKRDRARLLELGADFNPPRRDAIKEWQEPSTTTERKLRELWSLVLGIDADTISANDSFLRVGDSIQAMRLVGIARQQDLRLTVAEIFQHPILADMAKHLGSWDKSFEEDRIRPYTLLHSAKTVDIARQQAASLCNISIDDVEDIFPCTPLQEGLLALTTKREGDYTGRNVLKLDPSVDILRFKSAWEKVVLLLPILRTRIINLPDHGLVQVILQERQCWTEAEDIEGYLKTERQLPMGLGSRLMRCGLISESIDKTIAPLTDGEELANESFYFVLTMHHSIYDGLTLPLILETLENLYNGNTLFRQCSFQSFVKYIGNRDRKAEASFWEDQFRDIEATQFPTLPSSTYQPQMDSILAQSIEDINWRADDITPSTVIRAAFALLCSQYSNSVDVVFGSVVDGRKAPVEGIERLVGPTIATVPIRVKLNKERSIAKFLGMLQHQATEMIPYEQTGLSAIRLISEEAQQACQFQTLLVVQPHERSMTETDLFISESRYGNSEIKARRYRGFSSYALLLICTLNDKNLKLEFCFDSRVIENETIQRMTVQYEQLLKRLCSHILDATSIDDFKLTTNQDLNEIWQWNSKPPETIEKCVHHLIEDVARTQPNTIAISAWDGDLSYELLDRLSNAVAYSLVDVGIQRNMIIPACFEKSKFAMVAFLGIIKAGGAVILLDPALPESRLKAIVQQVNPMLILTSTLQEVLSSTLGVKALVVGDNSDFIHGALSKKASHVVKRLPDVNPSDLLYAIFTSGSGEEVTKDDVTRWMPNSNTFISYGPAECSAGTVGELYLEGALVGKGYLGDEEKTEASFVENPAWLLKGSPDGSVSGRRGRLYKTGDLVKYDPIDGTFIFVGRKDTQVKLRGQRIELSEVEHHVRNCLPSTVGVQAVIAEIVTPKLVSDLEDELGERLPSYMVPTAYIVLPSIPLGASVDVPSEGLVQVQIKEPMDWSTYDSIEEYLEQDKSKSMGLGQRLTRLAIVEGQKDEGRFCLITQHHAIYDGYSLNLLLTEVSKAYSGTADNGLIAPFQRFIKHIMNVDQDEARIFWSDQFSELEATPFPVLPHQGYQPKADSTVKHDIANIQWLKRDATASTIIRAAWSILVAHYTDSNDVIFGAMVTGRQVPLAGIDRMIAPLINAVPVRVKIDPKDTVGNMLQKMQKQAIATIAYEQTELLDIRRLNADAERATRFNTLLVVQPPGQYDYANGVGSIFQDQPEVVSTHDSLDDFNPNAVMVMCHLTKSNDLHLEISFDSNVIDSAQMERIANQFEHILRQICISTTLMVEDIDALSGQDIKELWRWNGSVPVAVQECVHDLIGNTMKRQPQAPAICSWDGNLSYFELDNLSHRLASHLSMWYPVAALGAMRAGATCVAMDSTQPESRLRSIVQQVNPRLILSSVNNETLANRLSETKVIGVDRNRILEPFINSIEPALPKVHPSDILYATHQADILHIREGTRVFDFVSYSFDVSWSNHLQTLICGGCLCIPSESERKNDIATSFNKMKCDYVYFTPSVARSLEPSTMPGIKYLAMGGEPIQTAEISRWTQAKTIIGIYGPAECAQALSFALLNSKTRNNHIGDPFGARTWLVQPGRPDRLAAIGTVGELMIEGPTVSKGYFEDEEKTKTSYIHNPVWLSRGSPEHPGRCGTLYKTGDLLRYNSDGSMDFLGRKDGMIKLRGQRIELTEVEYHVRCCLGEPDLFDGIAAEIIVPQNSINPILAVFLSLSKDNAYQSEDKIGSNLTRVMEGLEQKLWDRVPQYMVPGAYIHIDKIPMTATNKTDRRSLREFGSKQTLEQLAKLQSHDERRLAPSTTMEKRLQALWCSVLEIKAESISTESSFLRIGGESIAAMRLVSAAREQNLSLTVADIFKAPRLSDLALLMTEIEAEQQMLSTAPFSLLKSNNPETFLENFVKPALDADYEAINNVIPATDFQERSVLDALQDPPSRYPHWIFDLPADVDFIKLQEACFKLVSHFEILRTVFIQANNQFWQVLLSGFKPEYDLFDVKNEDITSFTNDICEKDLNKPRRLGHSFIRFISIKHFSGKHNLGGFTPSVVFHAACAMALSRHFQQKEIIFGRLVTGRSMLPSDLQNVAGPCMTEVPIRVNIGLHSTLIEVASQLQDQFIKDSIHEAAGMVEIIRNCTDWPEEVADFGWRTSFQQEEETEFSFMGSQSGVSFYDRPLLPRNRPEIYATPREGNLDLEFEGNGKLTSEDTVKKFLTVLQGILEA